MILIYGAIALLVVAIADAVLRTQGAMQVSREGSLPGVTSPSRALRR